MPAGVVETASGRVYSKGTKVYVARNASPTNFNLVGGVVGVDGQSFDREEVDGTELDPIGSGSLGAGETEEEYYWKYTFPGDKSAEVLTLTLNMKPTVYALLKLLYDKDELANWKIVFRNGDVVGPFYGFVKSLGKAIENNQLVKTPVGIRPIADVDFTDN